MLKIRTDEILWNKRAVCSDGVGYDWIDQLKAYCESNQDTQLAGAAS
jgi:hypothetical protein